MQERFKQIREYYNLSQAQFAQKIHRVPAFIANVETGRCGISGKTLDAICEAFPINRGWLMSGEGEMFTQGEFAQRIGYEFGLELNYIFDLLI